MTFRMPAAALAATALLVALSIAPSPASAAKGSKSVVREFTGTVASVKSGGKSFRLRRSGRAAIHVRVVRKTKVAKGAKPRKGRKLVIKARRSKGGWVARSVKLVPPVADEETESGDDALGGDDEEIAGDEEVEYGDEGDGVDLDDTVGDLFGDSGDEEE